MFFYPLSFYLKMLFTTLIVEVGLFAIFISRQPLRILSATCFNVLTHISLHIFFTYMVIAGFRYGITMWIIGELGVLIAESLLYYVSKTIPKYPKALFWAFIFNIASILVGQGVNLVFY